MHPGFVFCNTALEISLVTRHGPDEQYGEHPDKPSYIFIFIAGMAHPGMFQLVVTHLKALGTPSKECSTVLPSTKRRQDPKGANRIGIGGGECP